MEEIGGAIVRTIIVVATVAVGTYIGLRLYSMYDNKQALGAGA